MPAQQHTNDYRHGNSQSSNPAVKPVGEYMASKGTPVQEGAGGIVGTGQGNIQRVVQPHMSHYKAPKRRGKDNPDLVLCAHGECKAYPTKTSKYCYVHSKKLEPKHEAE